MRKLEQIKDADLTEEWGRLIGISTEALESIMDKQHKTEDKVNRWGIPNRKKGTRYVYELCKERFDMIDNNVLNFLQTNPQG